MITNNISVLLVITFICICAGNTYSIRNSDYEMNTDNIHQPRVHDYIPSSDDQYLTFKKMINKENPVLMKNRQFRLAKGHFDVSRKLEHTMDHIRDKRFWLFANKDENEKNVHVMSGPSKQQNSLSQGLWRSGIVGRRR
ncbi:hypothetical protein I4U23_003091 [Adineta vaga]|nr:hypothetical protein I4U23_003091 [Adineta vaga]